MPRLHRPVVACTLLSIPLLLTSCIILHRSVRREDLATDADQVIDSPVKVHMLDGSTVVFADGAAASGGFVRGSGWRYGLTLRDSIHTLALPVDSIIAMESFRRTTDPGTSVVLSVLATGAGIAAVIGAACAADPKCFGSCPTIYSDSGGVEVLEAEGFSYSIAPLLEARDVDRLRASARDGTVRLEIRNEALETHYINHLELLEVRHYADEVVLPAQNARILAVRRPRPIATAADRQGRDVAALLRTNDGSVHETPAAILAAARPGDLADWIDLEMPADLVADSLVLAFRMRNSLLATVLFYDLMLGDRGVRAIDWQANDLQRIATAMELGEWGREHLGMHVLVERDGGFDAVGRIADSGPVAWKDVAIVIPAPAAGKRIRLSFPSDGWRIDRVQVSDEWRDAVVRAVPLTSVRASGDTATIRGDLAGADDRYLVTGPGQAFHAEFDVGVTDSPRTFLLGSQGYYVEWIRREWLTNGQETTPFRPTEEALADAMHRWRLAQDSMETRFYATRVPVR